MLVSGTQIAQILYLYTFLNDHYNMSHCHLSPYKDTVLTIFPTLYTSYPWIIYFVTGSLYLLISLICFSPSPLFPLWQPPICCLYLYLCFCFIVFLHLFFFFFFRFHIYVKSYNICLSLSDLFHLASCLLVHPCCHR